MAMPATDKQFTGHQLEGSLYYMQARFYDPVVGRFLAPDSIVPDPKNPQALNRYSYVLGNPLRYTDPTGNSPFEHFMQNVSICLLGIGCSAPHPNLPINGSTTNLFLWGRGDDQDADTNLHGTGATYGCEDIGAFLCSNGDYESRANRCTGICSFDVVDYVVNDLKYDATATITNAFYLEYFFAYQQLRMVNKLPGQSEWAVKYFMGPAYVQLIVHQAAGLAGNTAGDWVETNVLGVDEPVFDDRVDKNTVPIILRPIFEAFGLPQPVQYAPGISSDPWGIDFQW